MSSTIVVPFRWDVSRREQLGRLAAPGPMPEQPHHFTSDLRDCCARVLSVACECDIFFVGRSPESLFDYLRGLCFATSWAGRLNLLPFSMRGWVTDDVRRRYPGAVEALRAHWTGLRLDPVALARRERPVALIDLVSEGLTMRSLIAMLRAWCDEVHGDWPALARKLRVIGIISTTWSHRVRLVPHGAALQPSSVVRVRVNDALWDYLGNKQPKTCISYSPDAWGDARTAIPPRGEESIAALRLARNLFERGRTRDERKYFVRALSRAGGLRSSELRSLCVELRRPRALSFR